jgi:serine/threonine protein kinase
MNIAGYRILETLGKGAMATVFRAIQESLDREVALKVMAPQLTADEDFCRRFLAEGKIIANLVHPNIVTVFDIGVADTAYYMVLEYASGGTLTDRMSVGALEEDRALLHLEELARALSFAHSKGFVHRDVKPGNVLFRPDGTALLSDFGIAKALEGSTQVTAAGWSMGTPHYMSPEQAMGTGVDTRSDIYSLGVVFFEMLTGRRPFECEDPMKVAVMHVREPVPALPDALAYLGPLISRMLAKDPDTRFSSCEELIRSIGQLRQVLASGNDQTRTLATPVTPEPELRGEHAEQVDEPASEGVAPPSTGTETTVYGPVSADELASSGTGRLRQLLGNVRTSARPAALADMRWIGAGAIGLIVLLGIVGLLDWGGGDDDALGPIPPGVQVRTLENYVRTRLQHLAAVGAAYRDILTIEPDNAEASDGIDMVSGTYAQLATYSWQNVGTALAAQVIAAGLQHVPEDQSLLELRQRMLAIESGDRPIEGQEADRLLDRADRHLGDSRFLLPVESNAVEGYKKVLQIDPGNETARERLHDLADMLERSARSELQRGDLRAAAETISGGLLIDPSHPGLMALRERFSSAEASSAAQRR